MNDSNLQFLKLFDLAVASPYVTAGLALLGLWLLILIFREFTVWYLKIHQLNYKLDSLREASVRLEADIEKLSDLVRPLVQSPAKLNQDFFIKEKKSDIQFPIDR